VSAADSTPGSLSIPPTTFRVRSRTGLAQQTGDVAIGESDDGPTVVAILDDSI
jgi:hypothetical protein